jgi:uncharacterized membrane protein
MSKLLWAALLSMTPVGELRVGIPYALASGINPWLAYVVCVLANIAIVPVVYFFLEFIHRRFLHVNSYQSVFDKFMERCRKKVHPLVEKYGMVGLAIFVAVPIPATGAYTATVAAWFLGMNKWKVFLSVAAGVVFAGAIMLGAVLGGIKLVGLFVYS